MKVVILAGGLGTRLSEETTAIPKPMVKLDHKPILWHIMKIYASYGYNEFIVCLGYKGDIIKEYFYNYYMHNSDITIKLDSNEIRYHGSRSEDWMITLADTGYDTGTAGRLLAVQKYIDSTFMLTYGDGVGNINIDNLLSHHKNSHQVATVTAVRSSARFGVLSFDKEFPHRVSSIREKQMEDSSYINGGFFVMEPEIFSLLSSYPPFAMLEQGPLQELAHKNQLSAYIHNDFWYCVDTIHDLRYLQGLCKSNEYPWLNLSYV